MTVKFLFAVFAATFFLAAPALALKAAPKAKSSEARYAECIRDNTRLLTTRQRCEGLKTMLAELEFKNVFEICYGQYANRESASGTKPEVLKSNHATMVTMGAKWFEGNIQKAFDECRIEGAFKLQPQALEAAERQKNGASGEPAVQ